MDHKVSLAAFGLDVLEAQTEMIGLRMRGVPLSQVYRCGFVYLGGNINRYADLSIEVGRRIRHDWCSHSLELYDRSSALLELNIRILKANVLESTL